MHTRFLGCILKYRTIGLIKENNCERENERLVISGWLIAIRIQQQNVKIKDDGSKYCKASSKLRISHQLCETGTRISKTLQEASK